MTIVGYLRLRLTLQEPGGVSAAVEPADPGADDDTGLQLPLDRDDHDRIYLPETTVAGALRAHLRNTHGENYTHRILGASPPPTSTGSPREDRGTASRLSILSSIAVPGATSETRTTTAIDRERGAAQSSMLRHSEHAAAGTAWDIYCSWTEPDPDDWTQLLDTLTGWAPLIGHGVSTGHGRSRVTALHTATLDLHRDQDLLTYLTRSGHDLVDTIVTAHPLPDLATLTTTAPIHRIDCTIEQALHISNGRHTDTEPKVALFHTVAGRPTVPGSTIKGILRSRIEYILRSVHADPAPCLDRDCQHCLACQLFGYRGQRAPGKRTTGARARIRIPDAPIDATPTIRIHAPIDRFTGGVANQTLPAGEDPWAPAQPAGLLHCEQVIEHGAFALDIEDLGLGPHHRPLLAALLRLVIEDLNDGLITIGRGGTRGHGRITATTTTLPTLTDAQTTLSVHLTERTTPGAD